MSTATIPAPGELLAGRYRVVRMIGQGGMGAVLEAVNTTTGKRVAIKWLSPQLWGEESKERFLREAQASSRVRHPNVVDVYDFVDEGERFFLVMQLLEGEPLTDLLARGNVPLHQVVSLLIDAMRGVAAAHAQGVIHRDIKPDNIFLERQTDRTTLVPKVIDFGVSKIVTGEALSLTQSGTTLGTPLYMSYEQLRGAKDVDVRTDVYSFGVILYEVVTGQPPYEASSLTDLVVKLTTTMPQRIKSLRPDVPTALDHLVHWAMALDREQRVPSIDALIRELEPFASEHGFRSQMTLDGSSMPRMLQTPTSEPMTRAIVHAPAIAVQTPRPIESTEPPAKKGRLALLVWGVLLAGAAVVYALVSTPDSVEPRPEVPVARLPAAIEEPQGAAPSPQAAEAAPAAEQPVDAAVAETEEPRSPAKTSKKRAAKLTSTTPAATEAEPVARPAAPADDDPAPKFRAGRALREDF